MKGFIIVVLTLLIVSVLGAEDYYKLLGVTRDADEKTIKKVFKGLSLEHHPDRGHRVGAERRPPALARSGVRSPHG